MMKISLAVVWVSLLAAPPRIRAEDPPALSLREALTEALVKSPELAKLRLRTAEAELEEARLLAETDPELRAAYAWTDDELPRAQPAFQGARSTRRQFDLGVAQDWLTGTQARLFWRNEFLRNPAPFRPLDPSVDSRLTLELRQPLLRYFWGRPDKARRSRARARARTARQGARHIEERAAAEAVRAYIELHAAREGTAIALDSLASARRLQAKSEEKRRYGLVEESDLLQAQVSVQLQETELALAQTRARRAENALLSLLQRSAPVGGGEAFQVSFPGELPPVPASLEGAVRSGLGDRGDVRSAKAALEAAEWDLRVVVLDGLPDLALNGSYGVGGLARDRSEAWNDLGGFDHAVRSAGVSLSLPFGRRREKLDRRAGTLALESRREELRLAEQTVQREVRDAWEDWELARVRLADGERLLGLEGKKLAAEEANFRRGRSSTDLLVRFQQDLARARSLLVRARADEVLARVELNRASGGLMRALGAGE